MRLLIFTFAVAAFSSVSGLAFAQHESDIENDGQGESRVVNSMWEALLSTLDARKGLISYQDINRAILEKFDCKDEYARSYINAKGDDAGAKRYVVKSRCKNGLTINYSGPESYGYGDKPANYDLDTAWFPSKTRCFHADVVLRALSDRGWTIVDTGIPAELGPKSETLKSKFGNLFIHVTWVPEKNPMQFYSVEPSKACLLGTHINNH